MKTILSKALALTSMTLLSAELWAACSVVVPQRFVRDVLPGPVILDTNVPVGTPLSSIRSSGAELLMRCDTANPGFFVSLGAGGAIGVYQNPNGLTQSIYPTGITGVGVVMSVADIVGSTATGVGFNQSREDRYTDAQGAPTTAPQFRFRFIRTSGTIPAGTHTISNRRIGSILLKHSSTNATLASSEIWLNSLQVRTAAVPTCDLAAGDTNRTITLDPVRIANFTGISTGLKYFDLTATCSNAANVTFRFTGTPASTNPALFANTGGTAGGVALWLHTPNQTISHNSTRTVAVSGNRAVLRVGAEYHKTSGALTKGTLVSTVTVNISYN